MAEGEVLVHGHVEEVGEVGYCDGAVGPGAGAVDFVVGVGGIGYMVSDAAVAVVGQVVAEGHEGGKGVLAIGWWRSG